MRLDRMTTKSQEAIRDAFDRASRAGNPEIVPEHMLAAILAQADGIGVPLVQKAGGDSRVLTQAIAGKLAELPKVSGGAEPTLGRRATQLAQKAEDEAKALKDDFVSVEHFLLAGAKTDGEIKALFARAGIDGDKLLRALKDVRGAQRVQADHQHSVS